MTQTNGRNNAATLPLVNLALKFILELAALVAFAWWGTTLGGAAVSAIAAIAAPATMIALWGTFAAPRARRRLRKAIRIPFELFVFALAAAALFAADAPVFAAVFAALVVLNSLLLSGFDQWDG